MKTTQRLAIVLVLFETLSLGTGLLTARAAETATRKASAPANSEERPDSAADRSDRSDATTWELDLTSASGVEITDSSAQFDLSAAQVALELPFASLSAGVYDFSWEGAESLSFANGAAEPWAQLLTVGLRKTFQRPLNEKFLFTATLGAGLSFEEEASDSLSADALAAVIWNKSADWSFLFGVGYSWHSKVDVEYEIIPAIGFSYRQNAEQGFSASLGIPQTGIRYRFSPRSSVALSADAQTFVARLADDSEVAAAGYAEFLRFDLGLYYEHRLADRLVLKAGPTFGFAGELKIHDRDGVLLETHDLESAPGLALKISGTF